MTARKPRPPHIEGYAVSYTTYVNHRCRCEGCAADHRRKHKQWRDSNTDEQRKQRYRRIEATKARQYEKESATAPNRRKPWTDEDRAVALNPNLNNRQAANILGRTTVSVRQFRAKLRKDSGG